MLSLVQTALDTHFCDTCLEKSCIIYVYIKGQPHVRWLKFCFVLTFSEVDICALLRYYQAIPRNMPEGRRSQLITAKALSHA